jgi:hypothetical protein
MQEPVETILAEAFRAIDHFESDWETDGRNPWMIMMETGAPAERV